MDSRYDNLLDEETHPVWGKYVRSNEKIFWEGSPHVDMSIRLLESRPFEFARQIRSPYLLYHILKWNIDLK